MFFCRVALRYFIIFILLSLFGFSQLKAQNLPMQLSRMGSRFTIVPEIHNNHIRILPLGYSLPEYTGLSIVIEKDQQTTAFFGAGGDLSSPLSIDYSPTSLSFSAPIPNTKAVLTCEILSPFTPSLPDWRTAPIMFIKVTLTNKDGQPVNCTVSITGLHDRVHTHVGGRELAAVAAPLRFSIDQSALIQQDINHHLAPHLTEQRWSNPQFHAFTSDINGVFLLGGRQKDGWESFATPNSGKISVHLQTNSGQSAEATAAVLFYTSSPILLVDGHACSFSYSKEFRDPIRLLTDALENRHTLLQADAAFRATLQTTSLTETLQYLTHTALQSFLACTWSVRLPDGSIRYSEWEGYPLFHSTMDVVFNSCLFHLAYTPDYLKNMLLNWPRYAQDGDMPHDMGKGLVIHENAYPVKMQAEENCNYLLLHAMYAARTHDFSIAKELKPVIERVVQRLISSDTDGDGLPNTGTINTFDDAPVSINMAENQVYLGIKKAAALQAVSSLFPDMLDSTIRQKAQNRVDLIYSSIIKSWTGTHFPIALSAPEKEAGTDPKKISQVLLPHDQHHPITANDSAEDDITGYSNYAAHGLVPLWLCGLHAPSELEALMKTHLETAHEKTTTPYGDAHRDGQQNVWVSQNMWRDLAALYLGADIDFSELHRQYTQVQSLSIGRRDNTGRWEGFCDSPFNAFLTAYSRGIPILGFSWITKGRIQLPKIQINE
ncbi:MAG: glycoside hydrolase family 52 protein [bacterium]